MVVAAKPVAVHSCISKVDEVEASSERCGIITCCVVRGLRRLLAFKDDDGAPDEGVRQPIVDVSGAEADNRWYTVEVLGDSFRTVTAGGRISSLCQRLVGVS